MKYIECSGTAEDMGLQYGEQAKDEILMMLDGSSNAHFPETIKKHSERIKLISDNLYGKFPEIYQEISGIAKGCGASFESIFLLNHLDTFGEGLVEGCTPVGLLTENDGVIIAKNNDGHPRERNQYPFVIRKSVPERGFAMLQVTYAGWISGLDAMNSAGLANTHGSVGSAFDKSGKRIDIRLAVYALMRECETVSELYRGLNELSLTGKGFNIIIGDSKASHMIVEAAVPLIASRKIEDPFFYTTNHFLTQALKEADMRTPAGKRISTYRMGYLDWIAKTDPPHDINGIKRILSSHEPWAPCRHGGAHVSETFWSYICIPSQNKIFISHGAPCEKKYKEYSV